MDRLRVTSWRKGREIWLITSRGKKLTRLSFSLLKQRSVRVKILPSQWSDSSRSYAIARESDRTTSGNFWTWKYINFVSYIKYFDEWDSIVAFGNNLKKYIRNYKIFNASIYLFKQSIITIFCCNCSILLINFINKINIQWNHIIRFRWLLMLCKYLQASCNLYIHFHIGFKFQYNPNRCFSLRCSWNFKIFYT